MTSKQLPMSISKNKIIKNAFFVILLFFLSFLIGYIDFHTGPDFTFSPGYLFPPAMAAWRLRRKWGVLYSLLNSVIWLWVDFSSGRYSPVLTVYLWNFTSRLIFLIVVVHLINSFRISLNNEQVLANTDFLTKALNSRKFKEPLALEINRSIRYHHPLTLVYLDIDNFKVINDQFGHGKGDMVLSTVAQEIRHSIRHTDVLGRMGGDEFAILLIETDPISAETAVTKLKHHLMLFIEKKDG